MRVGKVLITTIYVVLLFTLYKLFEFTRGAEKMV